MSGRPATRRAVAAPVLQGSFGDSAIPAADNRARWFGHPPGLTVLFLTQMWEQFSYYGMYTLLVLYMRQGLGFDGKTSSLIFGIYTAAIYGMPLAGGWIADRFLGRDRAVILGSLLMCVGHFMMSFPSLLFPALTAIASGTGLFIPNLAGQIPGLYRRDDPLAGSAFNIYYVGTNLGGVLAFVAGLLASAYGWHWGFSAAGVGMLVGLAIYLAGRRHMPSYASINSDSGVADAAPRLDRRDLLLLLQVILIVVLFRAVYMQSGNTLLQWAFSDVDRNLTAGLAIPTQLFANLNPLFVLIFGPLLAWRWAAGAARGRPGAAALRMAAGTVLVAAAYGLTALVAWHAAAVGHPVRWPWLVVIYLLLTLGELHVLPIGLGLFGKLAPARYAATVIAAWFFAGAGGNLLGGVIGVYWSREESPGFFVLLALLALVTGALLFSRNTPLEKLQRRSTSSCEIA